MDAEYDWTGSAACRPDNNATEADRQRISALFFPTHVVEYDARAWMLLCGRCPVRKPCLRWALQEENQGVWGGLHERERWVLSDRVANGTCTLDEAVDDADAKIRAHEQPVKVRRTKRRRKPVSMGTAEPFVS